MSDHLPLPIDIFGLSEGFEKACLEVFQYQAEHNPVYKAFVSGLKIRPRDIVFLDQIPFLPIEFFKTQLVITEGKEPELTFTSSGTGGSVSKHLVADKRIYEASFRKGFGQFYDAITDYCLLALLPSYLEREGSSLVYMAQDLIKASKNPDSGFYLNNREELAQVLTRLEAASQPTLLLGVSYALLDFAEEFPMKLKHTMVMETGGMKGKRREYIREELHEFLCSRLGITEVHSEYGMTELLSQAYSKGNGKFECPPWMKILIRDPNDPRHLLGYGKTGGINIIDLANIYSCSFIATQDLGKRYRDDSFEVLGRFDNSDIRGCNLMIG